MKSFIVLTFVFLALAFYQMSGGADFQPRKQAVALPEPAAAPDRTAAQARPRAVPATARAANPVSAFQPAVTPARMEPAAAAVTALGSGHASAARVQTALSERAAEPDPERLQQVRSSLSQGLSLIATAESGTNAAQGLTLVSLGDGSARLVARPKATEAPAEPGATAPAAPDIREITGTRVNMRDGPGTLYPVLAQLGLGQQVEVLSDSGTGWLRLRSLPDRQLGWISASLVSKPAAD